ncbi:uncharacterized protein SOCG_03097 [Schizosaccharomyces octosporus yFS286]|uniref:Uncharacterized protein n=1 Tax=Schizosaccharomyces octosporus (strain yFS286) TaxID=483514 RepID=S9Q2E4_SCHOY|nr:uncharacterized protein SOCG_03097 [Schizosaccharomyces octosporus yFS286]EPX73878.1 hypothetical protein SOCG_03097 [Schizosaccharomyces octosporus yFS286]
MSCHAMPCLCPALPCHARGHLLSEPGIAKLEFHRLFWFVSPVQYSRPHLRYLIESLNIHHHVTRNFVTGKFIGKKLWRFLFYRVKSAKDTLFESRSFRPPTFQCRSFSCPTPPTQPSHSLSAIAISQNTRSRCNHVFWYMVGIGLANAQPHPLLSTRKRGNEP